MASSIGNLTGNLTLNTRFAHLYRPLIRNLILIVAATVVLAAAILIYFDGNLVRSLSQSLIEKSTRTTIQELEDVFAVANRALRVAQPQTQLLEIGDGDQATALFSTLEPFLAEMDLLDSLNIADSSGSEFAMIKTADIAKMANAAKMASESTKALADESTGQSPSTESPDSTETVATNSPEDAPDAPEEILIRRIEGSDPGVAHWQRRIDGVVVEEWQRHTDVSPHERPWYQGAQKRAQGSHYWSEPYAFLTSKEPGISVSSRWPRPDGNGEYVVALNLSLMQISHYTTNLRPSEHGMNVIFTDDGQVIGLPPDPRFKDHTRILAGVLSPVTELGVAALDAALAAWQAHGSAAGIFSYDTGGAPWWAGFSAIELDEDNMFWSAVLIPETDFLGSVAQQRNLSLAGIGLAGILIAALVLGTSMRSIRRQMNAAVDQAEQRFGQYQLKKKIGEGGNGSVYQAQHCLLRRPTAIKLMNPDFMRTPACRERFEHEVQITSNLSHPNTIAIYDYGQTPEGTLYYAMELLNGGTLEQLVACSGPMPAGRVIHVLEQIAGSLSEAHGKGLIHRDIKPSNAIVCERGGIFDVVKVLDFGLVKEVAQADAHLTQANVLVGTPLYMAPEIIRGPDGGSAQSDLYAVGATGYFLLTGRNVFEGASSVEICAKHLNETPMTPSQRVGFAIPEDLEAVIMACLAKDPANRPADAGTLRASLLACRDAAKWTQPDAREWWQTYQTTFVGSTSPEESSPLSNTEIMIDMDDRLGTAGSA